MFSVIIPSYNEEDYIEENLLKITGALERTGAGYELVVIEESSDRTPEIVERLSAKYSKLKHLHFNSRLGKGRAVEKGIEVSKGEYVIFMDADLSTDLSSLPLLMRELEKNDIVVGSRYHKNSRTKRMFVRLFLGRSYSMLVSLLLGLRISDAQCGFKGFRKSCAVKIIPMVRNKGFFWDTEFLFYAKKLGYKMKEIPITWTEKTVRGSGSGKIKNIIYMGKSLLRLFARSIIG